MAPKKICSSHFWWITSKSISYIGHHIFFPMQNCHLEGLFLHVQTDWDRQNPSSSQPSYNGKSTSVRWFPSYKPPFFGCSLPSQKSHHFLGQWPPHTPTFRHHVHPTWHTHHLSADLTASNLGCDQKGAPGRSCSNMPGPEKGKERVPIYHIYIYKHIFIVGYIHVSQHYVYTIYITYREPNCGGILEGLVYNPSPLKAAIPRHPGEYVRLQVSHGGVS